MTSFSTEVTVTGIVSRIPVDEDKRRNSVTSERATVYLYLILQGIKGNRYSSNIAMK